MLALEPRAAQGPLLPASVAAAGVPNEVMEADFAARINQERTSRGLRPLGVSLTVRGVSHR